MTTFDAIVVAGGDASRLGGVDKGALVVAGVSMLDRARQAVAAADRVVVIGPEVSGGPVAAIAARLSQVRSEVAVVLACDMPFVTAATVDRLVSELAVRHVHLDDAALLTDRSGRRQFLAGAYRSTALRDAITTLDSVEGCSMRKLVERLRVRDVPAHSEEATDCDTWADVEKASMLLERP